MQDKVLSLEALARTIAKARHGTDAMWANYMGAARAVMSVGLTDVRTAEQMFSRGKLTGDELIAPPSP